MLLVLLAIVAFILIMGYVVIKMFDDYGDLTAIYLLVVASVCVFVFCLCLGYSINEYSCEKKATAQSLEYKYDLWTGCLVKERDGNYIDYDKYRVVK